MIVDANILLYAANDASPQHDAAAAWLTTALNGPARVGLPWESLGAYLRIATGRGVQPPLAPARAFELVEDWLAAPAAWVPLPTERHGEVLGGLIRRYDLPSDLLADARLAALAIEHGVAVVSADTDFARFRELRWVDPIFGDA